MAPQRKSKSLKEDSLNRSEFWPGRRGEKRREESREGKKKKNGPPSSDYHGEKRKGGE